MAKRSAEEMTSLSDQGQDDNKKLRTGDATAPSEATLTNEPNVVDTPTVEITNVEIVPKADLKVLVANKTRFHVLRSTMCVASPVWRAMLDPDGHFVESAQAEVNFPDDDPDAFELLLLIIHLQYRRFPETLDATPCLSSSPWWRFMRLCDKYDTIGIVRPFQQGFLQVEKLVRDVYSLQTSSLLVTWIIGKLDSDPDHVLFLATLRRFVQGTWLNGKGNVTMWPDGTAFHESWMPPGVLTTICAARSQLLAEIVTAANSMLRSLCLAIPARTCTVKSDYERCQSALVGAVNRVYFNIGLIGGIWSSKITTYDRSVSFVVDQLKKLPQKTSMVMPNKEHNVCTKPVKDLLDEIDVLLTKHLAKENLMPRELLDELAVRAQR